MRICLYLCFLLPLHQCQKAETQLQPDSFWQHISPADAGLDPELLKEATDNARRLSNLFSLLVVKNGKIVVEEYFSGYDSRDKFHLRSITKNITSAATAIAIEEKLLDSMGASIAPYFSQYTAEGKESVTIQNVLNMQTGIEWSEDEEVIALIDHLIEDPIADQLDRDFATAPGTAFNYNSANPHLLAEMISNKSGQSYEQFVRENVMDALGIGDVDWERDPQGRVWGGFGLQMTARDLARFGLLYLNNGKWNGEALVSEEWVEKSAVGQTETPYDNTYYSLQWWISDSRDTPLFYGQGYGGQGLLLLPAHEMMVIVFQKHLVTGDISSRQWSDFISQVFNPIFSAIE